MSNHSAHEIPTTMTPEERRAHLQAELEARKQAIEALSDEELEKITGGSLWSSVKNFFEHGSDYGARRAQMTKAWGGKTFGGQ